MTANQRYILSKVQEHMSSLRCILDDLMYRQNTPLTDEEYNSLREAYDLICKANDKIGNGSTR